MPHGHRQAFGAVTVTEIQAQDGAVIGELCLNSPQTLNALTLDMIDALYSTLVSWKESQRIVAVVIRGSGAKAFCAGGDVKRLHGAIEAAAGSDAELASGYAAEFFSREYRLNYLIHTYSKPIVVWGTGYVIGGGVGLMAGASHRVVTETTRWSMPEITIGFYPDVGGTYFLPRIADRMGLFVALTAAQLNAADTIECNVADYMVDSDQYGLLIERLCKAEWSEGAEGSQGSQGSEGSGRSDVDRAGRSLNSRSKTEGDANHKAVSDILSRLSAQQVAAVQGNIGVYREFIRDDLLADMVLSAGVSGVYSRFQSVNPSSQETSAWLSRAGSALLAGSPTSAAVILEIYHRSQKKLLSLEEAFKLELSLSLGFCAHHDFAEGVRARLVDKDNAPVWRPNMPEKVRDEDVADHFTRFASFPLS